MFAKTSNTAYIMRKNINLQNIFIRKKRQNDNANFAKNFTKRLIFNVLKIKRRRKKLKL